MTTDPRSRILTDLRDLITNKRIEGFRPILMTDVNDEWLDKGSKEFQQCVDETNLVNPLHQKHGHNGIVPTTFSRGKGRIDVILVNNTSVPAIKRIGTLGLHEGIILDHAMLYMNCNETRLFSGIINRPVLNPSREFVIKHADKCEKSVDKFCEYAEEKKFAERIPTLP